MTGIGVLTRTLGDAVMINVLARNIKIKYPDLELHWIIEEKYGDVIKHNPDIKNIILIKDTLKDWNYVLKVISKMYDKVFMFAQVCPEDGSWHQRDKHRFQNLIDFYAKRGRIELVDRKLRWYFGEVAFPMESLREGKKVFCHTTTLGDAKNWSKFKTLAEELRDNGYVVYQVGLKSDVDMMLEGEYDLRGKYNLQELAGVIKSQCGCFVGLDSGLSFVAAAVEVPVICIMGASVPQTSSPWGDNVIHLLAMTRNECERKRCHALFNRCKFNSKCIDGVVGEEVVNRVKEVFGDRV